ncbi:type II toxin-antitoxin system HipA family toxin [Marinimicrobium sp. ABcell2]|uniref:type II toxin-antitoxin system HipA family toxin n=1 Tax=Marinimicrobium sp. ABcell2 TaxID=3069751 RepID=UPI0027B364B9|nr:type II toxin-antitoxin system HipA family toxin [Marinimicrobium sp. ABcell2]MDQ2077365.1 type II toxin-antitoxin system HipA family toxin [Marinimicrobium sp. ABcell2]
MVATIAEVTMWGQRVGALAAQPDETIAFEYEPDWISTGTEISPLKLPSQPGIHRFTNLSPDTFKGLPGAFADTLPDDFGNAVINAWLARQGIPVEDFGTLDRLLYTGNRGMGALEYHPARKLPDGASMDIQVESLLQTAQQILDQRANLDVDLNDNGALQSILQVGTSAGGARPKAVVAVNADRTQIRSGQVSAPAGFTHYLLKFDGVVEHRTDKQTFGDPQGFGRMEYAYYRMAVEAGITMEPSELLEEGGRAHFLTRRFDRDGNHKRHYQSLCAIDHADYKKPGHYSYEELFTTARRLRLTRKEAIELYRRMVFNVVARNHDDHTKNFGFLLDNAEAKWRLAPAFDVAYSYRPDSSWVNNHQLSLNGKRDEFTRADLLAVARQISEFETGAKQIIDQVCDAVAMWPTFARNVGVPSGLESEIQRNLRLSLR